MHLNLVPPRHIADRSFHRPVGGPRTRTLDELAAIQHVVPVDSLDELATDLSESDEELDPVHADVSRTRHTCVSDVHPDRDAASLIWKRRERPHVLLVSQAAESTTVAVGGVTDQRDASKRGVRRPAAVAAPEQGGTAARHKTAGRKGGRASARKAITPNVAATTPLRRIARRAPRPARSQRCPSAQVAVTA